MKRLCYILLLTVLWSSCERLGSDAVSTDGVIDFAAPKVIETKSLIKDVSEIVNGFSVFATKSYAGSTELFMDNIKVSSTLSDGVPVSPWTYDADTDVAGNQSYYWSPGAEHRFYAVYPYNDANLAYSYEAGKVMVTGKVVTHGNNTTVNPIYTGTYNGNNQNAAASAPDILCGYYSETYDFSDSPQSISFDLEHAFAAISLKIRNASEYNVSSVTAIDNNTPLEIVGTTSGNDYKGLRNTADKFYLTADGVDWSSSSKEYSPDYSFTLQALSNLSDNIGKNLHPSDYWYTTLVIPQDFAVGVDMTLSFKVTFEGAGSNSTKDYTLNLEDYKVENGYSYKQGKHYVYSIDITAQNIACDVSVVPWIEDDVIELK